MSKKQKLSVKEYVVLYTSYAFLAAITVGIYLACYGWPI